jgi:hypothetical protein
MEWLKLIATLAASLGTFCWAFWKWLDQRKKEDRRRKEKDLALYVIPFLQACEELQSRLYNVLERKGLQSLTKRYGNSDGSAKEILYLIVQYFAWERCIHRYGPYALDLNVMDLTEKIRATFATDSVELKEPEKLCFCFFRPEQKALGQMAMRRRAGQFGPEFETISLHEFKVPDTLDKARYAISEAEAGTSSAKSKAPPFAGWGRLAEVQNYLVELLSEVERKIADEGHQGFTLFFGKREPADRQPCWEKWSESKFAETTKSA